MRQELDRENTLDTHEQSCDALILHYLGLDHIGHFQGPRSSLLPPKLVEMDNIIKEIYEHIEQQDHQRCTSPKCGTLLVITGDHGMNELGNHGGSSSLEIETALLLVDPKWKQHSIPEPNEVNIVNQVDLIPSLSLLFGLPIPKNSLGKIISHAFPHFTEESRLRAYATNADQLIKVIQGYEKFWVAEVPQTDEISKIWEEYQSLSASMRSLYAVHSPTDKTTQIQQLLPRYEELVKEISEQFVALLTEYDTNRLFMGVFLIFISCCVLCGCFILFLRTWDTKEWNWDALHIFEVLLYLIGFLIFFSSLFTSSLVEEEHQTWYFLVTTICLMYFIICMLSQPSKQFVHRGENKIDLLIRILGLLVSQRIMRSWNQTGNKWLRLRDIGDTLDSHSSLLLILCVLSSLTLFLAIAIRNSFLKGWHFLHTSFVVISSLFCCFVLVLVKMDHIDALLLHSIMPKELLNQLILLSFGLIACQGGMCALMFACQFHRKQPKTFLFFLRIPIVLLLMILHKPRNQWLILVMVLHSMQLQSMLRYCHFHFDYQCRRSYLPALRTIIVTMWCSKSSYFMLGNSNSLASIDIGGAYTGKVNVK